jgi:hypothetical protein
MPAVLPLGRGTRRVVANDGFANASMHDSDKLTRGRRAHCAPTEPGSITAARLMAWNRERNQGRSRSACCCHTLLKSPWGHAERWSASRDTWGRWDTRQPEGYAQIRGAEEARAGRLPGRCEPSNRRLNDTAAAGRAQRIPWLLRRFRGLSRRRHLGPQAKSRTHWPVSGRARYQAKRLQRRSGAVARGGGATAATPDARPQPPSVAHFSARPKIESWSNFRRSFRRLRNTSCIVRSVSSTLRIRLGVMKTIRVERVSCVERFLNR